MRRVFVPVDVRHVLAAQSDGFVLGDFHHVFLQILVHRFLAAGGGSGFALVARDGCDVGAGAELRAQFDVLIVLGLVELDMLLHALDQVFLKLVEHDGLVGDLAQRHDRVLVVVAVERELRAAGDVARALRRQQHQLEPVRNLENAVFDGNARHEWISPEIVCCPLLYGVFYCTATGA